jgi:anti-sigma regulatory factor (Ser/Thr protein kinase)
MHFRLSDTVLDVVQNAVEAGSGLVVLDYIDHLDGDKNLLRVCVADDGKGMDEETLKRAQDPFYSDGTKHSGRKVGLGLPFLRQLCDQCGGRFEIESRPGEGTSLFFELDRDNVDFPPEGDVAALFTDCLLLSGTHDMAIHRFRGEEGYSLLKSELISAMGSLEDAEAIRLLTRYIGDQEAGI